MIIYDEKCANDEPRVSFVPHKAYTAYTLFPNGENRAVSPPITTVGARAVAKTPNTCPDVYIISRRAVSYFHERIDGWCRYQLLQ